MKRTGTITRLILGAMVASGCGDTPLDPLAHAPPFFTAVVNGVVWQPTGLLPNTAALCQLPDVLTLSADSRSADGYQLYSLIALSVQPFHGVGYYPLGRSPGWYGVYRVATGFGLDLQYSDSTNTNYVRVTSIDKGAHLVAGTFAFHARTPTDTVTIIQSGAFHLQYVVDTTLSTTGWCAS